MRTSEIIADLVTALAAAQAEIHQATESGTNPFFNSSYSTLADIWDACRQPLSKHGLSVVQTVETAEGRVTVTTRLFHNTGQWIESAITLTPEDSGPQPLGSIITYGRRYTLAPLVGIASANDDDAESGTKHKVKRSDDKNQPRITDAQRQIIENTVIESGAEVEALCEYLDVKGLNELSASRFDEAMKAVEARKQRMAKKAGRNERS